MLQKIKQNEKKAGLWLLNPDIKILEILCKQNLSVRENFLKYPSFKQILRKRELLIKKNCEVTYTEKNLAYIEKDLNLKKSLFLLIFSVKLLFNSNNK